jgi:hypothetical protein
LRAPRGPSIAARLAIVAMGQADKRCALYARELALEFLERIARAADKKIRSLDTWETGTVWRALLSEEKTTGKQAISGDWREFT